MSLTYKGLASYPEVFLRVSGITKDMFDEIIEKLKPLWEKEIKGVYKRPGRNFKMPIEDIVLMALVYYRTYTTMIWLGFLFNLNGSTVSRLILRVEPLLAKIMTINKNRELCEEELQACLIDATEQKTQRPSIEKQKPFYSGKKKEHTLKTEVKTTMKEKITNVSESVPGAMHDYALRKLQPALDQGERAYVDSGYQGLQKEHAATELPFKATKKSLWTKSLSSTTPLYRESASRLSISLGTLKFLEL